MFDNIAFGLREAGRDAGEVRASVEFAIDFMGLNEFAGAYPAQLSGGRRQRVCIARTLVMKPRLILLDEPFGALDQQTRLLMGDELLRLWRETGATILLITHAIDEAAMLADRVGIMSARPGIFLDVVATGWPRERDSTIVSDPAFGLLVSAMLIGPLLAIILHQVPAIRRILDPLFATYYAISVYAFYPLLMVIFGLGDLPQIAVGFLLAIVAVLLILFILTIVTGEVGEPILVALYSIPKVTLYPVIVLVFGIGMPAKVAFGAIQGIVPIALFAMNAIRNIRPVYTKTARVLRLRPAALARSVLLPAALPEIVTGIRVGFSLTLVGTLLGEMFGAQRGLGFLLLQAMGVHNMRTIMAVTLLLVIFAATVNGALLAFERRLRERT